MTNKSFTLTLLAIFVASSTQLIHISHGTNGNSGSTLNLGGSLVPEGLSLSRGSAPNHRTLTGGSSVTGIAPTLLGAAPPLLGATMGASSGLLASNDVPEVCLTYQQQDMQYINWLEKNCANNAATALTGVALAQAKLTLEQKQAAIGVISSVTIDIVSAQAQLPSLVVAYNNAVAVKQTLDFEIVATRAELRITVDPIQAAVIQKRLDVLVVDLAVARTEVTTTQTAIVSLEATISAGKVELVAAANQAISITGASIVAVIDQVKEDLAHIRSDYPEIISEVEGLVDLVVATYERQSEAIAVLPTLKGKITQAEASFTSTIVSVERPLTVITEAIATLHTVSTPAVVAKVVVDIVKNANIVAQTFPTISTVSQTVVTAAAGAIDAVFNFETVKYRTCKESLQAAKECRDAANKRLKTETGLKGKARRGVRAKRDLCMSQVKEFKAVCGKKAKEPETTAPENLQPTTVTSSIEVSVKRGAAAIELITTQATDLQVYVKTFQTLSAKPTLTEPEKTQLIGVQKQIGFISASISSSVLSVEAAIVETQQTVGGYVIAGELTVASVPESTLYIEQNAVVFATEPAVVSTTSDPVGEVSIARITAEVEQLITIQRPTIVTKFENINPKEAQTQYIDLVVGTKSSVEVLSFVKQTYENVLDDIEDLTDDRSNKTAVLAAIVADIASVQTQITNLKVTQSQETTFCRQEEADAERRLATCSMLTLNCAGDTYKCRLGKTGAQ